ncbi:hypothetical protein MGN70_006115 [Eutypa lata]|nr:hypothetical protein MGN70_006115 [Eutypa lata]
MSTSTNEEHQGTEDIRSVNLDKIRHDQDKLYHAAVGLQHEVKRLHGNQEIARQRESVQSTLSGYTPKSNTPEPSAFWSGLQWIPAEWDYPSEDASAEFSCFGNSQMDVLVYDCLNSELRVWPGLSQLQGKRALFARLPSRWCSQLQVCVEKITTTEARNVPRYRITDKAIPYTMTRRQKIPLTQLDSRAGLKVLLGRIKWIFVLHVSREFSNLSGKSADYSVSA